MNFAGLSRLTSFFRWPWLQYSYADPPASGVTRTLFQKIDCFTTTETR